ncbi:hypothetical protein DICPUDRAFT_92514 [Dictyostelium purpureum]|uniref:PH domain-containing protein n=1 Tax=Dictyostelium purpureum TaxID=5786 RepID=F0ZT31_DICPU|nr:uncharacterized protein DICPUDRAFT_92514 [Dictyostelium purpureum]EGC32896.1 hypothetical protein DICPUDRAFT_92514 [Dictyostelium purpureum]|eukprot:XP_003290581.1 hypothetical protein DICPUDRAFT_92514 [Dictyostelium purpureum]
MRLERDESILAQLSYKHIKDKMLYSAVMKKAGGNKKGFLSRLFVLYKSYIIYYKPKSLISTPEKPQGYIDLRECDPAKVKTILDEPDMTFQIVHRAGRIFLIKGEEMSSFKQFYEVCRTVALRLTHISFTLPNEKAMLLNQILECNMTKEEFKTNVEVFLKDGFIFNVNLITPDRTADVQTFVQYILGLRKEEITLQIRIAKIMIESGKKQNCSMMGIASPAPATIAPDLMVTLVIPENEPLPEVAKLQRDLQKIRYDIEEHRLNIFNIQAKDCIDQVKVKIPTSS